VLDFREIPAYGLEGVGFDETRHDEEGKRPVLYPVASRSACMSVAGCDKVCFAPNPLGYETHISSHTFRMSAGANAVKRPFVMSLPGRQAQRVARGPFRLAFCPDWS